MYIYVYKVYTHTHILAKRNTSTSYMCDDCISPKMGYLILACVNQTDSDQKLLSSCIFKKEIVYFSHCDIGYVNVM